MIQWLSKEKVKELQQIPSLKGVDISIQSGWFSLVKELGEKLNSFPNVSISQIKSKFGTARIYHFNNTSEVSDLIDSYIDKLNNSCEFCGSSDNVLIYEKNKFVFSFCEKHSFNEYGEKLKEIDFLNKI